MKVGADVPSTSSTNGNANPKSRPVTVRDEEEDEAEQNFAPGGDADYYVEEDDEGGRFFGGGLTDEQKKILNIFDRAGGEGAQDEDVGELCCSCICCFAVPRPARDVFLTYNLRILGLGVEHCWCSKATI